MLRYLSGRVKFRICILVLFPQVLVFRHYLQEMKVKEGMDDPRGRDAKSRRDSSGSGLYMSGETGFFADLFPLIPPCVSSTDCLTSQWLTLQADTSLFTIIILFHFQTLTPTDTTSATAFLHLPKYLCFTLFPLMPFLLVLFLPCTPHPSSNSTLY